MEWVPLERGSVNSSPCLMGSLSTLAVNLRHYGVVLAHVQIHITTELLLLRNPLAPV